MNTAIKWLLALLGLVALLVVASMVYITQVFDPNSLRPEIERAAKEQGVPIQLKGPISWQWYPHLGLSIGQVEVSAAGSEFVRIASLSSEVAIAPLLQGRIAVEGIRLQGVSLNLVEDARGRANWQVLAESSSLASSQSSAPAPGKPQDPTRDAQASTSVDLAIDHLEILDLNVHYQNQATQQRAQVAMPSCVIGGFNLSGQPFDLECRTQVQFAQYPQVEVHSHGQLSYDAQAAELVLRPMQQQLSLGDEELSLTFQGSIHPQAGRLALDLTLAPTNLRAWLKSLSVELPAMSNSALQSVAFKTHAVGDAKQWQLRDLVAEIDGARFSGVVSQNEQQHLSAKLQGTHFNLDDYLPPTSESSGAAAAAPTAPKAESTPSPSAAEASGPASRRLSSEALDFSALQQVSASVDAKLKGLQVAGAVLSDVLLQARLNDGVLELKQLQSTVYEGQLNAAGVLNTKVAQPTFKGSAQLQTIALQPLLQHFADEARLQGEASLDIDVAARGTNLAAWQQSLVGNVALTANALQVAELDIERDFCEMAALLNRKPTPQIEWQGTTELQKVKANLTLNGERVRIEQLQAGVEELALSATGSSRYIQGDFDVRGALRVTGEANPDRACQIRDRWRNRDLPLRCRGNIDEPLSGRVCGPDRGRLDDLLKEEVKGRVEEKLQEKLQDKLNLDSDKAKQVEQLLRGIFGR